MCFLISGLVVNLKLTIPVLPAENNQIFIFSPFLQSFDCFSIHFAIHDPSTRGWRRERRGSVTGTMPARCISNRRLLKKGRMVLRVGDAGETIANTSSQEESSASSLHPIFPALLFCRH